MSDETQHPSDDEILRVCSTLQAIAERFPSDSKEALATRDAALAYTIVHQHDRLQKSYNKLRRALGGELSEEIKAKLRRHGMDPDELEAGISDCENVDPQ